MKTANKHLLLSAGLMALGLAAGTSTAFAQNTTPASPAPPLAASVAPAPAVAPSGTAYVNAPSANPAPAAASAGSAMPASSPPPDVTLPKEAATEVADPDQQKVDAAAALPGSKKDTKTADENGPKVPASVKGAIKNLKVKSEDLTLDDLNAAREAIAKLDALIDIEKRLVELDKVRKERENDNNKAMLAALPASALAPPMGYMQQQQIQQQQARPVQAPPAYMPPATVDVERIEGSNDHYLAFIKEGDSVHQVRTGDHLSDGSVVTSISPRGVEIKRDEASKPKLVQVKDVQAVFGDAP